MRRIASLVSALTLAAAVAGCSDAADYAASISASLRSEQAAYQQARAAATSGLRGDAVVDGLQRWASSLTGLATNIDNLSNRLRRHPEERAQVDQAFFSQLQTGLNAVLGRDESLRPLTPSWRMNDAARAAAQISGALSTLRTQYAVLFETGAPGREGPNPVDPMLDSRLYDTFQDCVNQFAILGMSTGDHDCERYGRNVCGHQMRLLSCVAVKIMSATVSGRGCSVDDCTPGTTVDPGQCTTGPAPWISEVRGCASTTPIEGPAN